MSNSKKQGFLGKIFSPKWDTIARQVINLVFLFFGNKIKGYRTVIVNTITAIVGALLAFQAEPMLNFICGIGVEAFCGGENSVFVGYVMIVIGLLNNILRKVTGDEIEVAAFGMPNTENKGVKWIAAGSIIALGITIITLVA